MNDLIKYMIVSGTIAGLSMAAGVVIGAKVTAMKSEELRVKRENPSAVSFQQPAFGIQPSTVPAQRFVMQPLQSSPSIFPVRPGTGNAVRLVPSPNTNVRFVTSAATGSGPRLVTSSPAIGMNYATMQKVQSLPEVKQAREAAAEAQRKYFDAMKKAMEKSGQPAAVSSQPSVVSGQKAAK